MDRTTAVAYYFWCAPLWRGGAGGGTNGPGVKRGGGTPGPHRLYAATPSAVAPAPTPHFDEQFTHDRLHALLVQADFVVVTAPRTPATVGMLGETEFRAMKPSAYYICVSRGGIADDAALLRALREGWIAGGGLNTHAQEPLPADSPFWALPNTIITPHNGATTPQTRQRGIDIFVENLRRYQQGRELVNVVDKQAGY